MDVLWAEKCYETWKIATGVLRFVFKDKNSSYVDLSKRGNLLSLSAYRIRILAMEV